MSKMSKFFRQPLLFWKDAFFPKHAKAGGSGKKGFEAYFRIWQDDKPGPAGRPVALMFGFTEWKRSFVRAYMEDFTVAYTPVKTKFSSVRKIVHQLPKKQIVVWGQHASRSLVEYCAEKKHTFWRMEDGFIRSAEIGAKHTPPMSLVIDRTGLYYDPRSPSDLEILLKNFDPSENPEILERAKHCMALMRRLGVSKYNHAAAIEDIENIYGPKTSKRVLVIGQVEDDASILTGAGEIRTNESLVKLACKENPGAQIIYKPHPDVLAGCRKKISDPGKDASSILVVTDPLSTPDALRSIDHVYTMTSLVGMEALIWGIPVTCAGAPFYAGWGLTDDRYPDPYMDRRGRDLTLEALYACAYLLYPQYRNPENGKKLTAEQTIYILAGIRNGLSYETQETLINGGYSDEDIVALTGEEGALPKPLENTAMSHLMDVFLSSPDLSDLRLLVIKHLLLRYNWAEAVRLLPYFSSGLEATCTARQLTYLISRFDGAKRHLLVSALEQSLRRTPALNAVYAAAFKNCGQPRLAIMLYKKAVEHNPAHKKALSALVMLSIDNQDLEAVGRYTRQLQDLKPRDTELLFVVAEGWLAINEPGDAIAPAELALVLDPANIRGYQILGKALRLIGRDSEALSLEQAGQEAGALVY